MKDTINKLRDFESKVNTKEILNSIEADPETPVEVTNIIKITGIEGNYIGTTPANDDGNYIIIYKAKDKYILVCNNINLL